ncbi:MAG: hypothetical protein RMK21_01225 [Aquificaceae bacterium]|nr:hypothetical protein [Aquificaceae bacterium]
MLALLFELLKKKTERGFYTAVLSLLFWLLPKLTPLRELRGEESSLSKLASRTLVNLLPHSKTYVYLLMLAAIANALSFLLFFSKKKVKRA